MVTKQIIKKLQSFLTEEEAKIIIPLYKQNYEHDFGDVCEGLSASEMILYGFAWDECPQGVKYWDIVHKKITNREKNDKAE